MEIGGGEKFADKGGALIATVFIIGFLYFIILLYSISHEMKRSYPPCFSTQIAYFYGSLSPISSNT